MALSHSRDGSRVLPAHLTGLQLADLQQQQNAVGPGDDKPVSIVGVLLGLLGMTNVAERIAEERKLRASEEFVHPYPAAFGLATLPRFEGVIAGIVALDMLRMASMVAREAPAYSAIDFLFGFVYTCEQTIRFFAFGWTYFFDMLNGPDLLILILVEFFAPFILQPIAQVDIRPVRALAAFRIAKFRRIAAAAHLSARVRMLWLLFRMLNLAFRAAFACVLATLMLAYPLAGFANHMGWSRRPSSGSDVELIVPSSPFYGLDSDDEAIRTLSPNERLALAGEPLHDLIVTEALRASFTHQELSPETTTLAPFTTTAAADVALNGTTPAPQTTTAAGTTAPATTAAVLSTTQSATQTASTTPGVTTVAMTTLAAGNMSDGAVANATNDTTPVDTTTIMPTEVVGNSTDLDPEVEEFWNSSVVVADAAYDPFAAVYMALAAREEAAITTPDVPPPGLQFETALLALMEVLTWTSLTRWYPGHWAVDISIVVCMAVVFVGALIPSYAATIDGCHEAMLGDDEQVIRDLETRKKKDITELAMLFLEVDTTGDGDLNKFEFEEAVKHHPRIREKLLAMGASEADMLDSWNILDDGDGILTIDEFAFGIRAMQGPARSRDVLDTGKRASDALSAATESERSLGVTCRSGLKILRDLDGMHEDLGKCIIAMEEMCKMLK